MPFFYRRKIIDADLGEINLQELMKFPKKENAGIEEFYLKEMFHPNHIQIGVKQSRVFSSGIHDFEYSKSKQQIKIFSRFKKSAFLIYSSMVLPLIPLAFEYDDPKVRLLCLGLSIGTFLFSSMILIVAIMSESKKIEREMTLRINYARKRGL